MPAEAAAAHEGSIEYKSLGLRLHANSPCISYVFLKHHKSLSSDSEVADALYVTGLPLVVDEAGLKSIFSVFGSVSNVVVHPTKRSAALVYHDSGDVLKAVSHTASGQVIDCQLPLPAGPVGLKAWVAAHKAHRPGNQQLQKQLDGWVEVHEEAEAARAAAAKAAMAEDGWTVVVRSKGRKRARQAGGVSTVTGGVARAAAAAAAQAAAVAKTKHTENFYRFQQRDKRRSELLELRQKFEEGRRRLAAVKAARHFKPQ